MDFIFEEKYKNILLVIMLIVIGILSFLLINKKCTECEVCEICEVCNDEIAIDTNTVINEFYVDIKGAVKKPGVYKVSEGAIVNDLISMAGGLKSNASTKYINLSYVLNKSEVIYIYTTSEVKNVNIKDECNCPKLDISSCNNSSIVTNNGSSNDNVSNEKININKASIEELMKIPGVGESKAKDIIAYRESNNGFKSIDEITKVSGIGESTYNKIKEYIEV